MELILDVNTQIFPMDLNDKFRLMLATTLRDDGYPDEGEFDQQVGLIFVRYILIIQSEHPRMKQFEYVMYGKIYRIESDEKNSNSLAAYASFGGLLMRLKGDVHITCPFKLNSDLGL